MSARPKQTVGLKTFTPVVPLQSKIQIESVLHRDGTNPAIGSSSLVPSSVQQSHVQQWDLPLQNIPHGIKPTEPEKDEELDYPLPNLIKMDFSAIKSQPFDFNSASDMPGKAIIQAHELLQRLEQVLTCVEQEQAELFASLDIDQWEDAGDWIMERFADISKRLKKARRTKRKLTMEFEDEIEKRYLDVNRKKQLTEQALADMKQSGGKVLEGTPKKTKA